MIPARGDPEYPHLLRFSTATGIAPDRLIEAFRIERAYHDAVLAEGDPQARARLTREVYERVHPLYGKSGGGGSGYEAEKMPLVRRLADILVGRSILDVGCGNGAFLHTVARAMRHGRLLGIDGSPRTFPRTDSEIDLREADITDFDTGAEFDVALSDNVTEHVAPADLPSHLASIRRALRPGGSFVLLMPNRLFGPSDVTRIVDFTYTGRVPAQGTHLNESTWMEMIAALSHAGFESFRSITTLPLAFFLAMERSPALLGAVRALKSGGRPLLRRQIALACRARSD